MNQKKIGIIAGTVAAGTAIGTAAAYIITKGMVQIAIEREMPKVIPQSKKVISGSQDPDPFTLQLKEYADRLTAVESEQIELEARDGTRLVGHWYPCEGAQRVIIAMHGWRSSWANDFGMIADFWHDSGCSVLFAEQRGQNNSGGKYMTFGYLERYDCLDWTNWATERTGGQLPIYLCGVSMGAATVLMTAGLELPDSVHGVIADCGFTSAHEIWKHVVEKNLHLSYKIHGYMINSICQKKINANARDISTLTALPNATVPILFIHGSDDTFVPIRMTYDNYKACAGEKRLLVIPGAGHGQSYFIDKERYEKETLRFWEEYDLPKQL